MERLGIPYTLRSVVSEAENCYLGHVNFPFQIRHEVVEILGRIYDPWFSEALTPDKYLRVAYQPEKENPEMVMVKWLG